MLWVPLTARRLYGALAASTVSSYECVLIITFMLPSPLDSMATGIPEERYQQREGELYKSINRVYCSGCGQQCFIIVGWGGDSSGRGNSRGLT
jgi:hypothetical protein